MGCSSWSFRLRVIPQPRVSQCTENEVSFPDKHMFLLMFELFYSFQQSPFWLRRNRQLQFHRKIFSIADVIVTPTVGCVGISPLPEFIAIKGLF